MKFFGKNRDKPDIRPEEINYTEVDLTEIEEPVYKAKKIFDSIVPGISGHIHKADIAIGMALTLNNLANEIDELEPGFKEELIKCFKKY